MAIEPLASAVTGQIWSNPPHRSWEWGSSGGVEMW